MEYRFRRKVGQLAAIAALFASARPLPALAGEVVEEPIALDVPIVAGASYSIESLLGSVEIEGGGPAGRVTVRGRVVAEAASAEEARALAKSVSLDRRSQEGAVLVHVLLPLDRGTAFFPPRDADATGRTVAGWIDALAGLVSETTTTYDGRDVRIGRARGALGLAVHLSVTLPDSVPASVDLRAGPIRVERCRGRLRVALGKGRALVEQMYGALDLEGGIADVTVRTFKGERLRIETSSGEQTLVDVDAAALDLRSGGGAIRAGRVRARSVAANAGDGEIVLDGLEADRIDASTGSGDLTLATGLERRSGVTLRTGAGDVRLRVGAFAPFLARVETASGSVRAEGKGIVVEGESGRSRTVRRGSGGSAIRVETGSGDVHVAPR